MLLTIGDLFSGVVGITGVIMMIFEFLLFSCLPFSGQNFPEGLSFRQHLILFRHIRL